MEYNEKTYKRVCSACHHCKVNSHAGKQSWWDKNFSFQLFCFGTIIRELASNKITVIIT
jgi:hypothetical protein